MSDTNTSDTNTSDTNTSDTKTIISSDPLVETYDNFISDKECSHFIEISKQHFKRALVAADNRKKGTISDGRTNQNTWISHDHDEITSSVAKRIADLVEMPLQNAERFQVIYYDKSEQYKRHYDSWEHNNSEKTLRCMKYGGARVITSLCYLNDVEEGGGTHMSSIDKTIDAIKGRMLVFKNTLDDSHTRHPNSDHAGLPVIKGEKYAFNLWFREAPRDKLYSEINPEYYESDHIDTSIILNTDTTFGENAMIPNQDYAEKFSNLQLSKLHYNKHVYYAPCLATDDELEKLKAIPMDPKPAKLSENYRENTWVEIDNFSDLVSRLENITGFDKNFFCRFNIVKYAPNSSHGRHHIAFENSSKNKTILKKHGQRILCINMPLTPHINISFPTLALSISEIFKTDGIMHYTCEEGTSIRDNQMECVLKNTDPINPGYVLRAYIKDIAKVK